MMKKIFFLSTLFILSVNCFGQIGKVSSLDPTEYIKTITATDLKKHLYIVASDEMQGRETGSAGQKKAGQYLIDQYKTNTVSFPKGATDFYQKVPASFLNAIRNDNLPDSENIWAFIEGSEKPEEIVVVSAHYDHIGFSRKKVSNDSLANGANDNATGTSAVIALAKHFSKKKLNKRSLMFVLFSAEEKGLLGSKHLAKKLKDENLNLYTMVNFEMIGVPFQDRDYTAFVSGYEMSNMAEKINTYTKSNLIGFSEVSKKYNLFRASDNHPFYYEFRFRIFF